MRPIHALYPIGAVCAAALLWWLPPRPPAAPATPVVAAASAPADLATAVSPPVASPVSAAGAYQGPGTRKMAALLRQLSAGDPMQNMFVNSQRVPILKQQLARTTQPGDRVHLSLRLAREMLNAGQPQDALALLDQLQRLPDAERLAGPKDADDWIHRMRALGYLRVGEQENCIDRHGSDSCLLPIRGNGVHTRQQGSRAAIGELTGMLRQDSHDVMARWLLNLAYMTVGEYPAKVPPEYAIPPKAFESDYDIGRYPDVAIAAGVSTRGLAGGSIIEDFDNDGLLDIMASGWGLLDPIRLYHNNGDGTFTDRAAQAGLTGVTGGLNIVHADYNNDGFADVLVLRGAWVGEGGNWPSSLLRNNGDGTFEDVTEAAGMLRLHPTQVGVFFDYDNDGWLDIFIGPETRERDRPHPVELFHNNHDGTFTDRAADFGNPVLGFVKGATAADYNNDGRQDLYVSIMNGPNLLFRNDGPRPAPVAEAPISGGAAEPDWQFTEVGAQAGVTEPFASFPTWFFDYNNDGWPDLLALGNTFLSGGNIAGPYLGTIEPIGLPRLYRNRGDGTFEDVTRAARLDRVALVMGANFGDLDGDGYPDMYLGTGAPDLAALMPNRMFRNDGGKVFQDVTTSGGFGHLQKGHAVSFGDLDNDGDEDIFSVIGGSFDGDVAHSVLFQNPGHGHHFLTLRLVGWRSNRSAIGARIRVRVTRPAGGGPRDIYATVTWGGSFGGSSLQQEIGLGDARAIQLVEVTWPATGPQKKYVYKDVPMDRSFQITEGDDHLTPLVRPTFKLGGAGPHPASHAHH